MKNTELIKHLVNFITGKELRKEANEYIDRIEAGNAPEEQLDTLSKLSSRKAPKTKYGEFVPAILEAKKKQMTIAEILKEYKEKASLAVPPVTAAVGVTEGLLKSYLNGASAKAKGVVKVKEVDNTYKFAKSSTV